MSPSGTPLPTDLRRTRSAWCSRAAVIPTHFLEYEDVDPADSRNCPAERSATRIEARPFMADYSDFRIKSFLDTQPFHHSADRVHFAEGYRKAAL